MDSLWKLLIELFVQAFFKWLQERDTAEAVKEASKAGKVVKAFMAEYNA